MAQNEHGIISIFTNEEREAQNLNCLSKFIQLVNAKPGLNPSQSDPSPSSYPLNYSFPQVDSKDYEIRRKPAHSWH